MNNEKIRRVMFHSNIKQWEVAEHLGVSDVTVCRWLRTELSDDKKNRILQAISEIDAKKNNGSADITDSCANCSIKKEYLKMLNRVNCKECAHWSRYHESENGSCDIHLITIDADGCCEYGERSK